MIDGFSYTDTPEIQDRILKILRLLAPVDVEGLGKVRLGQDNDGGYVMLDDFAGVSTAYSLGINKDVSWDKAMAERGIDIYQYDHTIDRLPEQNGRFHWEKIGICGVGETGEHVMPLPDLIARNHHQGVDLILKVDIEGAEWQLFSTMPDEQMGLFRQIVCEMHGFQHVDKDWFYEDVLRSCEALSKHHRVVHVHANNNAAYAIVGGVPVPAVLEITFVRVGERATRPVSTTFPTALDMPCFAGRADYQLGTFLF